MPQKIVKGNMELLEKYNSGAKKKKKRVEIKVGLNYYSNEYDSVLFLLLEKSSPVVFQRG